MIARLFAAWGIWMLVAALAFAGLQTIRLDREQTKYAKYETSIAKKDTERARVHAADMALARETESGLATAADTARKEKYEALKNADLRIAALTDSLRQRPQRPSPAVSTATATASPGAGATGAGLYREDGLFLAGEAAAAQRIGTERDQCYALYDKARDALKIYGAGLNP